MNNIKIHIKDPRNAIETSMRYDEEKNIFFVTGSASNGSFENFWGTIPILMKNNLPEFQREGIYVVKIIPPDKLPNTKIKKLFEIHRIPHLDSKKYTSHVLHKQEFTDELH